MTPEEARRLIKADSGSTHGPGANCHTCKAVRQNAWEMTQQIAGMTYEYGVQIDYPTGERLYVRPRICTKYPDRAWWTSKPSEAHAVAVKTREKNAHPVRLVRRLVSQPEEVKP